MKPKNNHSKCFQHVAILALSHEEIGKNSASLSQIKLFIDKYNWEGINYPSGNDDREIFEKNNSTVARNFLYAKKLFIYIYIYIYILYIYIYIYIYIYYMYIFTLMKSSEKLLC